MSVDIIEPGATPELVPVEIGSASELASGGDPVTLSFFVTNVSNAAVETPFDLSIWVSADGVLDDGDTLLATHSVASIAALSTDQINVAVQGPETFPAEVVQVCVEVDSGGVIDEVSDDNNVLCSDPFMPDQ